MEHWQMWSGSVSHGIITEIEKLTENVETKKAEQGITDASFVSDYRRSKVGWLNPKDEKNAALVNMLLTYFTDANDNAFGVEIRQIREIQYTEYHSDEKGTYGRHMDTFLDSKRKAHRKLSMTLQLSDPDEYEGGDFIFDDAVVGAQPDKDSLKAFQLCSKLEGIIPALETAHAFAYLDTLMKEFDKNSNIIVNVSGRGDKDLSLIHISEPTRPY